MEVLFSGISIEWDNAEGLITLYRFPCRERVNVGSDIVKHFVTYFNECYWYVFIKGTLHYHI